MKVRTLAGLMIVAAAWGGGCIDPPPPEGFLAPEDSVAHPSGVFLSFRDNPVLNGRVSTANMTWLSTASSTVRFDTRQSYDCSAGLIRSTPSTFVSGRVGVLRPGQGTWMDFPFPTNPPPEGTVQADFVINHIFRGPALNLPRDGSPVVFDLTRIDGRGGCDGPVPPEDPDPGPPIGFDETTLGQQQVALHPDVLLLPVHVHVFADRQGVVPMQFWPGGVTEARVVEWFDTSPVVVDSVARINDDDFSTVSVTAGELSDFRMDPDSTWTQCNIQFRVVTVEFISQNDGLEVQLVNDAECRNECDPTTRLQGYWSDPSRAASMVHGIHVYMGGRICRGEEILGLTCSAGCAASPLDDDTFVLINMPQTRVAPRRQVIRTLAHEFGHYLGLWHDNDPQSCASDWPDTADPDTLNNLMTDGFNPSLDLTPGQCAQARCIAQRSLFAWGLASSTSECDRL